LWVSETGAVVVSESGPVLRALRGIIGEIVSERELAGRVCRACVTGLDVEGAAISLLTTSVHRETLSATDPTAATLEDLQFTLGEGACIEAAGSGRPVLVPDLHDHVLTTRWPVFAAAVAEQTDVRALFALPLQLGTINVGVLDLYRTTPGSLRGHELRDVVAAVDVATFMLLSVAARTGNGHLDDGERPERQHRDGQHTGGRYEDGDRGQPHQSDGAWWDGLSSNRAEVHQATGMILAQLGVPAQDAFVRLRAYAFAAHRPLAEVARDVVAGRLVFTQDMD
jgi:ANTAR domain/GAF domain